MANIKSAKKRINVISKKTLINKSRKSALKTLEKKYLAEIEAGNKEEAAKLFVEIQKTFASVGSTSTMHKKTASRKISRLNKRLNSMTE